MSVSAIALINESSIIKTADDVQIMATAIGRQIRKHIAPAWGRMPAPVVVLEAGHPIPEGAVPLYLLDDADQADALGYHDEDPQGRQYGRVFVRTILNNGGEVLTGSLSVASVASHEAGEWFIDPTCRTWDGPADAVGRYFAREIGDPVEAETYVMPTRGVRVTVSNFVFPEWFDPSVPAGSGFDFLGSTHEPFTMSDGGYVITMLNGEFGQQFGDVPAWRRASKEHPAARTSRRQRLLAGVTGPKQTPAPTVI